MNTSLLLATIVFGCYCVGSVMNAIWIANWFQLPDPRSYGSKNPGATNMLRSAHPQAAALTFLLDILKGVSTTAIALYAGYELPSAYVCGVAATIGHLFPIFHRFQGGKGAATYLGVILTTSPMIGLFGLCIWSMSLYISRNSGFSSIICAIMTPILISMQSSTNILSIPSVLVSTLIIISHHQNIKSMITRQLNHTRTENPS